MKNKKTTSILLALAGILLVTGIALSIIGLAFGDKLYITNNHFGPFSVSSWSDGPKNVGTKTYTSKNEITSIQIDAAIGDVEIVAGDEFKIVTQNLDTKEISFRDNNGRISFSSNEEYIPISFTFNGYEDDDMKIAVYVPESCKTLTLDSNLGDVTISDLTLDKFSADLDAGSLEANNIIMKKGEIDLNLGNIDLSGDFSDSLDIDVDAGDMDLVLNGAKDDYNYDLDTDLGDIEVGGDHHRDRDNSKGKDRLITADTNLGSLTISFAK